MLVPNRSDGDSNFDSLSRRDMGGILDNQLSVLIQRLRNPDQDLQIDETLEFWMCLIKEKVTD